MISPKAHSSIERTGAILIPPAVQLPAKNAPRVASVTRSSVLDRLALHPECLFREPVPPRSDARVSVLAGRTSAVLGADRFANSGGQNLPAPSLSGVTDALRNHGNGCLKQPCFDPERFRD